MPLLLPKQPSRRHRPDRAKPGILTNQKKGIGKACDEKVVVVIINSRQTQQDASEIPSKAKGFGKPYDQ